MTKANVTRWAVLAAMLTAAACSDTPVAVPEEAASLVAVNPSGGDTGVDPNAPITLEFSHAMGAGMEMYVALHEGSGVDGPLVDGTWEWSADRTRLTFAPSAPLDAQTQYTIHVGGGLEDENGHVFDLEEHGPGVGGTWATRQMMEDRMMGGGMMGGDDMMGPGWQHANGTFGMLFTFTTA
jgi:hypothetical protein